MSSDLSTAFVGGKHEKLQLKWELTCGEGHVIPTVYICICIYSFSSFSPHPEDFELPVETSKDTQTILPKI